MTDILQFLSSDYGKSVEEVSIASGLSYSHVGSLLRMLWRCGFADREVAGTRFYYTSKQLDWIDGCTKGAEEKDSEGVM